MNPKAFLLVTLLSVLCICAIASAQVEEITLSTYYPAPYGEYEEMAAEKLFTDKVIIGNMDVDGDGIDSTPADMDAMNVGSLLIENDVGIGAENPDAFVRLHVMGNNVGGTNLGNDGTDRPTIQIEGQYPNLIIKSQGNTNHSSTIGLWAFDGLDTRQWNMGVGQNGLFSMGYCTNQWNPHCGLNNYVTSSVLAMTTAGNVGIGTTAPGAKLDVGGSHTNAIRTQYLSISSANSGPTDRPYIRGTATHLVVNGYRKAGGGTLYLNYPGDLTSGTTNTRIQETLYISATGSGGNGNVGIGTTSPQAKLDVNGDTRITGEAIIGGGLKPDYDSGWFFINASGNQTHTLDHNLGSIPTKVAIYVSNSSSPTWVQPCNSLSRGIGYNSPENVWMSNTQFIVNICWADVTIYVDANNPAPPGSGIGTSETGYMRVVLWK